MLGRLNDAVAAHTTSAMMTMWCVYAFFVLAVLPAFWPGAENLVQYVSQSVIQLVALPLIMVGSSVLNRASEQRAAEDHAALMEELADIREILDDVRTIKASLGRG